MGTIKYAAIPTLAPSKDWVEASEDERIKTIAGYLGMDNFIRVVSANNNGFVTLSLKQPLPASERGTLLLDIEEMLKDKYDHGITVWLEPMNDKNSLRNLRGVEIK